jgi:hypothetical protein
MHIQQNEPNVQLVVLDTWPQVDWRAKLQFDPGRIDDLVLIVDEAQLCYWDISFWNSFLKNIDPNSPRRTRAILFASYGSPTKVSEDVQSSMKVPAMRRVGLTPVDHKDGIAGVGLFLQPDEFDDMIKKLYPRHFFDPKFLQYVFDFTAGHAGAVADFLQVVGAHDVSPCIAP